jgi:hypothetical protein
MRDLVVGMPLQVTISAEGYERHVNERVVVTRPDDEQAEEFSLDQIDPATVRTYRGRLQDTQGKPVAGAQLRLIAAAERDPNQRWGFPFNWQMIQSGQLAQQSKVTRFLSSATDAQGRFAFPRIPKAAEVELVWWGTGLAPGRADHLELLDEAAKDAIDITILPPARIQGTIDRKAIAGAGRIQVQHTAGAFDFNDLELKPDQTEFEISGLAAGVYNVSVMTAYERVPDTPGNLTSRSLASSKVTVEAGETGKVEFGK